MIRNWKTKPLFLAAAMALAGMAGCGYVERVDRDGDTDGDGPCPEGMALCGDLCVDLQSDRLNCGTCGHLCQNAPRGTSLCDGGRCDLTCDDGWWNNDDDLINGCEYECAISGDGNELCNGLDDDCDGVVDNFDAIACPQGQVVACTTACGSEGQGQCNEECRLESCVPPDETCNGLDDDCDGAADNGFACERDTAVTCATTCGSAGTGTCTHDCMLPPPGACQVPEETCNWTDDDCDGVVDEDLFGVVAAETAVTDGSSEARRPVLAFGDTVFLVAWEDTRDASTLELYGRALNPDGTAASAENRLIGNTSSERLGDMAWNGTHFGIAFASDNLTTNQDLWFAIVDEGANRLDSRRFLIQSNDQKYPSIAWSSSEWATSWLDNRDIVTQFDTLFLKVDPLSLDAIPSSEHGVSSSSMVEETHPDIAWSGSAFGVVWTQSFMSEHNVYISLLNEDGTTAVDDRPVSEGFPYSMYPTILWTSSEWIVAWAGANTSGDQGYFAARVDGAGNRIGDVVLVDDVERLFEESFPPLALALAPGLGLALTWQKEILADRRDIYLAPYTFDLEPLGETISVTNSGYSSSPALAWDGTAFGLVWVNQDSEFPEIISVRFARLGCTM